MSKKRTPFVIILDDHPDERARPLADDLKRDGIGAEAMHPSDLTRDAILRTDLVLVDFVLEDWPEREKLGPVIALKPTDGLALAAIVRRHAQEIEEASPTAVAIITSKLTKLMDPLPTENRAHIVARLNSLEWIFDKADEHLTAQVRELARAVGRLPKRWEGDGREEAAVAELLGVPWENSERHLEKDMLRDAYRCLPPVHELSEWSHGIAFIRWLLQRVFPYPCFLIGPIHLAARFHVDPLWLQQQTEMDSPLGMALREHEYRGILAEFSGKRWWRAGVEAFLWDVTGGRPFDRTAMRDAVNKIAKSTAKPSEPDIDPIVCYDQHFRPLVNFESPETAVRVMPDDWPDYADQPWISKEEARNHQELRALVVEEDRQRIDPEVRK